MINRHARPQEADNKIQVQRLTMCISCEVVGNLTEGKVGEPCKINLSCKRQNKSFYDSVRNRTTNFSAYHILLDSLLNGDIRVKERS